MSVAYAKGHETIGDLLAITGAGDTALWLEEHAVVAATRAQANRFANADEANLVRTARAAHDQLEAIRSSASMRCRATWSSWRSCGYATRRVGSRARRRRRDRR